MTVVNWFS